MPKGIAKGRRFACQNPRCGCEMVVTKASLMDATSNPRCGCGVEMKKRYVKPAVRTLQMGEGPSLRSSEETSQDS
jgi:hypothetical protein